jgi:6-phosphofructokinase 1
MGFQTTVEETAKAVEVAFVESQSHEFGLGLVRVFGRNSGFLASHVAEASGCANIVLVPEF